MELDIFHKSWNSPLHIQSRLSGSYNAINILAAVAVARLLLTYPMHLFKRAFAVIRRRIIVAKSSKGKSIPYCWMLIMRTRILCDMLSLTFSRRVKEKSHLFWVTCLSWGKRVNNCMMRLLHLRQTFHPHMIIGVGEQMQTALSKTASNHHGFSKADELLPQLPELIQGIDWVLIKGSRGMALESDVSRSFSYLRILFFKEIDTYTCNIAQLIIPHIMDQF